MSNERILKARELFEQFPENDIARFNLAQAYFDLGDNQNALEHLLVLCEKKKDWMVTHILLGKCYLNLGNLEAGKETLESAMQMAIDQHHEGPYEEVQGLLKNL